MPSLKEIAESLRPQKQSISLGANTLEIRGLTSGEVADISIRYPEFGDFINQGREGMEGEVQPVPGEEMSDEQTARIARKIDVGKALGLGRGAYPALIAAACDQPGDAETETIAASFAFEHQQTLISAIMRLTFPQQRPLAESGVPSSSPSV